MKDKLKSDVPQIQAICDYLLNECKHDNHLAERVMLEAKTVDKMYQYILIAVRNKFKDQIKNNSLMVKDDDVYNLAIHYFIEEDEDLKKEYKIPVTKAEIKKNTEPVKKEEPIVKPKKVDDGQLSLFDFGVEV